VSAEFALKGRESVRKHHGRTLYPRTRVT
jgi:hypothetical protein